MGGDEAIAPGTALSAQAGPPLGLAGLLVEFADPHFFLDTAALDELTEAANRLLGRLFVAKSHFDPAFSVSRDRLKEFDGARLGTRHSTPSGRRRPRHL